MADEFCGKQADQFADTFSVFLFCFSDDQIQSSRNRVNPIPVG
jgi:hypothetical protein